MQINIKSSEANMLIEQLAAATGESKTQAVTEAVRLRLASIGRQHDARQRVEDVIRIADAIRARLPEQLPTQAELDAIFYDEDGLPR